MANSKKEKLKMSQRLRSGTRIKELHMPRPDLRRPTRSRSYSTYFVNFALFCKILHFGDEGGGKRVCVGKSGKIKREQKQQVNITAKKNDEEHKN